MRCIYQSWQTPFGDLCRGAFIKSWQTPFRVLEWGMGRFFYFILVGLCFLTGGVFWFFSSSEIVSSLTHQKEKIQVNLKQGELFYKFIDTSEDWLARSGDLAVSLEEVTETVAFRGVQSRLDEILFILFYNQFIAFEENLPQKVILLKNQLNRSVESLVNQHGLPFREGVEFIFKKSTNDLDYALIDGKSITFNDLDKKHYLWGAYLTEKFHVQLEQITKIMKRKRVYQEARSQNMNVQDYKKKFIYKYFEDKISESKVEQLRVERGLASNQDGRKKAHNLLVRELERKSYNYFLEKYLLKLPIQVNLVEPKFEIDLGNDYVPSIGPLNSELKISFFADSTSPTSNRLVEQVEKLIRDYQGIRLEYRPVLAEGNSFQDLKEIIGYCVWNQSPDNYWSFLARTAGNYRHKTHEISFEVLSEMNIDKNIIEKCMRDKENQKVIHYHRDYARYLGIHSGPVLLINGEVLIPPVTIKKVRSVIHRRLGVADAALWTSI